MDNLDQLYKHYMFMGLNNNANMPEITRQYKDLMILWHPDKHYGDKINYEKYEDKTKKLNDAYQVITKHFTDFGPPTFDNSSSASINSFDIDSIPMHIRKPFDDIAYINGGGMCNIGIGAFNTFNKITNLLTPIANALERSQHKKKIECVQEINKVTSSINVNRHTITVNNSSYSKNINFVDRRIKKGNFIKNKLFKAEYTYSLVRYLDFLNENQFCGIDDNKWRVISRYELFVLMLIARANGYDVGKRTYHSMLQDDSVMLNGVYCNMDYLDHVPLNGKYFKDFLKSMGYYNMNDRYYWYEHQVNEHNIFDMETCQFLDINDTTDCNPNYKKNILLYNEVLNKSAALWPVNSGKERATDKLLK